MRIDHIDLMDVETVEVRPAPRGARRWGVSAAIAAAALVVGALLVAPLAGACDVRAFAPGSGDGRSVQEPLLVHDAAALDAVGSCLDRHHLQVTDILPNAPFVPIGFTSQASAGLQGSYDGGGHSIVDLRIFLPGVDGVALFAALDGGEVRDLTLLRPRVEGGSGVAAVAGDLTTGSAVRGVRIVDAAIVAEDVAALVAGSASADVELDVELRGGSVEVRGRVVGTHLGRVRPGPSGVSQHEEFVAGDVRLRDGSGPTSARPVGEVLSAG
jgi:hypothetical protein